VEKKLDLKRIAIFIAFAFGIAWAFSLVIYLTGGISKSPVIIKGSNLTLALLLLALGYMWAPALANLFTRLITRQGWQDLNLRPYFKRRWHFWLMAWLIPGLLTIGSAVVFFGFFPDHFDPSLDTIRSLLQQSAPSGQSIPAVDPWVVVLHQSLQALLIAPIINAFFTFGEEFGWRGYLLQKLMPLGGRRAMVLIGVIWGVWHWPVIAMGYNYGLSYPGAPWLGMLAMVWFTFLIGTFLGWVTIRSESVWPAVIGHAAVNGIAGWGALFVRNNPNPVLGPMLTGIVGSTVWLLLVFWLFMSPRALRSPRETAPLPLSVEPDAAT
jgi:membrane protease YdiL (CAAX protease family)